MMDEQDVLEMMRRMTQPPSVLWLEYRPGMMLAYARIRVPGWHESIEMTNVDNGFPSLIPGGMVGRCEMVTADYLRVRFEKPEANNAAIWAKITNCHHGHGIFFAQLSTALLPLVEVEFRIPEGKVLRTGPHPGFDAVLEDEE